MKKSLTQKAIEKYFNFLVNLRKERSMEREVLRADEIFKDVITKDAYSFMRTTFFRLKTFESWRGRVNCSIKFYKEEKEALNAMVFCFLLIQEQQRNGLKINWDSCIAYLIVRLMRKSLTWDMKPEYKEELQGRVENFDKKVEKYVCNKVKKSVSSAFYDNLYMLASDISLQEEHLYLVAKCYTNKVEYNFIEESIWHASKDKCKAEIEAECESVGVRNYISSDLRRLVSYISSARNSIRWQGCGSTIDCNILCHMLETAVLAWFMAIEDCQNTTSGNFSPAQAFLVGLYHDIPEIWTDDIPSSCKNEIGEADQNIRPATEEIEREVLQKNFYPVFSKSVGEYLRKNVMLESIDNPSLHKFIKKADYLSADFECYWMILQGSENTLFFDILKRSYKSNNRTPETKKLLRKMYYMSIFHIHREP